MPVTGADVAAFLGAGDDEALKTQAGLAVDIIYALSWGYTRGNGFIKTDPEDPAGDPCPELAAVIVAAAARLVANPEQIVSGVGSVQMGGGFAGWTLAEQFVLNRYRVRAQ